MLLRFKWPKEKAFLKMKDAMLSYKKSQNNKVVESYGSSNQATLNECMIKNMTHVTLELENKVKHRMNI